MLGQMRGLAQAQQFPLNEVLMIMLTFLVGFPQVSFKYLQSQEERHLIMWVTKLNFKISSYTHYPLSSLRYHPGDYIVCSGQGYQVSRAQVPSGHWSGIQEGDRSLHSPQWPTVDRGRWMWKIDTFGPISWRRIWDEHYFSK